MQTALVAKAMISGFKPDPVYTVSQWADKYRYLSEKGSVEPGRYRTSRTAYMKEIMDCLSIYSGVQEVYFMKGTQIGATEAGNNFFGYVVDASPGPMMMVFPTNDMAADHSKQKLGPTIDETPRLRAKIGRAKARDSSNTILRKEFPSGILFLCGANSPANFRHKSIRFLVLDDMDGYPWNVGDEGDPVDLAKKRTDSFSDRKKIYGNSTPTIKGLSRIEMAFNESDQRQYHVPCPHCKKKQVLEWGGPGWKYGIKFERTETGRISEIWYECKFCHKKIEEWQKTWMLAHGKWIPKYKDREKRGYHLSSLYSPLGWVSWGQIAVEFLEAKRSQDPEKLKVWANTRMADPWEDEGSQPEWLKLKNRAEPYEILKVPEAGLFLSAGIDVQDNRLAVTVNAWGPGEETWLIYWGEIYGNPSKQAVWTQLDLLLSMPFKHESGVDLHIQSAAVDSGGHHTQEVYQYCRNRPIKVMAIKGAKTKFSPIITQPKKQDVTWNGQTVKNGVLLWHIGTDTAKATLYSRLRLSDPGPGYHHFPIGLDDEFYLQLTAEKRITKRDPNNFPKYEWVKLRERNEVLDCFVYSYAAALRAGMARVDWSALKRSLQNRIDGVKPEPSKRKRKKKQKERRW